MTKIVPAGLLLATLSMSVPVSSPRPEAAVTSTEAVAPAAETLVEAGVPSAQGRVRASSPAGPSALPSLAASVRFEMPSPVAAGRDVDLREEARRVHARRGHPRLRSDDDP